MKITKPIMTLLLVFVMAMQGQIVSAQDQKSVEETVLKKVINRIKVKATPIKSEAVKNVLSSEIYKVTITIEVDGGYKTMEELAVADGTSVSSLPELNTNKKLDDLTKIINKDFKLTKETSAEFEAMLDAIYPVTRDKNQKAMVISGNTFTFIRGKFFDKKKGFIVSTDASGKVTDVSYSLEIK